MLKAAGRGVLFLGLGLAAATRGAGAEELAAHGLPDSVRALEDAAEAVGETGSHERRLRAAARVLEHALPAAQQTLRASGAAEGVVRDLDDAARWLREAVASGDDVGLRRAATDVLFAVADAAELFEPGVRAELVRLDALCVRVPLELEAGDRKEAEARVQQMGTSWDRLRVAQASVSATAARETATHLDGLEAAVLNRDLAGARRYVEQIAARVEEIEKAFPE